MGPVLVLAASPKPGVAEAVEIHRKRLEKDFGIAAVDLDGSLDLSDVDAKWAIVFGGDGAILAAARRMRYRPLPTLAVNFGRLGFLTEVESKHLPEALERIKEEKFHVRERMRLSASLGDWHSYALNDVVVLSTQVGRLFRVSANVERREAIRYAGDGLVIATPTGSTAYSLAAGGPIIDPDLRAIVLTPLAAHTLSQRPIVIPADQEVDLHLREGDPPGRIVVDGQAEAEIREDQRLIVRRADNPFLLIRTRRRSYYRRLRTVLRWGGQPKYAE